MEQSLKDAEALLGPPMPGRPKMSPDEENRLLKRNLRALLQTVESLNAEQKILKQERTELQGIIERDKAFNLKAQTDFKRTKEMTIYYQVLVHDFIKRTKVFESAYATKE